MTWMSPSRAIARAHGRSRTTVYRPKRTSADPMPLHGTSNGRKPQMERFGDWELESIVAVGGLGEVWRALRGAEGRSVACTRGGARGRSPPCRTQADPHAPAAQRRGARPVRGRAGADHG